MTNKYIDEEIKEIHTQNDLLFKNISEQLYQECKYEEKQVVRSAFIKRSGFDFIDKKKIIGTGKLDEDAAYIRDYGRFRSFELVANEIENYNIEGALAEVGVYRGRFAKLINARFPSRKCYLYDSFESFRPEEFAIEVKKGHCTPDFINSFKNTSVDFVMSIMPYPEKCVIRKGFFPESIQQEDECETFAFVSLDVDFRKSMYECIKFFYPRLNHGGYCFLHNYNGDYLGGVADAVRDYEHEQNIVLPKMPLADAGGTLVLVK